MRFALAQKAFGHTADYDRAIADYLGARTAKEAAGGYRFQDK
jgi:AICAR transformylase/IMP cyclohydrolase PurH